jgi:hypothetical protein
MGRVCSTHRKKLNGCRILMRNPEGKNHQEDLDVGGRATLKSILDRMGWYGLDLLHDGNSIMNLKIA